MKKSFSNFLLAISFTFLALNLSAQGSIISGSVKTVEGENLAGVSVILTNTDNGETEIATMNSSSFTFNSATIGNNYRISVDAGISNGPLNGVSTADLVHIVRHILGIQTFTNLYQYIAADVNNDNSVNGQDLIELRKLILGIYIDFPQNDNWQFVSSTANVINGQWTLINTVDLNNFTGNSVNNDFIAVKIGDIN